MQSLLPLLALLTSLVSLCIASSYAKHLFDQVGIEGVSALRIGFSMVLLVCAMRPWRRRWSGADVPALAIYGLTLGLMNLLFYESIGRIPLGVAIAIEFTGPLAVAIWHSRRLLDGLWVLLAIAGLGLLLPWPGADSLKVLDPQGVLYALAAAVCWAIYIVQGQRVAQRYGMHAVACGMVFAAGLVVPIGLWQSAGLILQVQWWWPGLVVALFSSALPYGLEMYALKHLPKHTFSICLSLEPAVGAWAGWWMLGEGLSWTQIVAIGLILMASIGSAWRSSRSPGA
jgi:inner membrane transporter RhtA